MERNPYSPTKAALNEPVPGDYVGTAGEESLASRGRRVTNVTIDEIIYYCIAMAVISVDSSLIGTTVLTEYLFFTGIRFGYYLVCEASTGRTVGKIFTGTRVVADSGGPPTFVQIVKRTLTRMVPFDAFSFLASRPGWHDRWSRTRVIRIRKA
jgi:uncharacterized RDD family membrane protein YckC